MVLDKDTAKRLLGGPRQVVLFADGASRGNPGPSGWGAVLGIEPEPESSFFPEGLVQELGGSGGQKSTNNRMELMGVIAGLEWLLAQGLKDSTPDPRLAIVVATDSAYVIGGATKWHQGWQKRGWVNSAGQPVANQDLWHRLLEVLAQLAQLADLTWQHVPGHQGVPGNERADTIATAYATGVSETLYRGKPSLYSLDLSVFTKQVTVSKKPLGKIAVSKTAAADLSLKIAGKLSPNAHAQNTLSSGSKKPMCYVSLVGGQVQTHDSWEACERVVKGVSGSRFQKVFSPGELAQVVAAWLGG